MGERFLLPDVVGDFLWSLVAEVGHSLRLLRIADTREQVCNLVSVHAWSWHLDRTSPVEIVMTQIECQLLQFELGEIGLIQRHEEVRGTHAALGTSDGHEEEVELIARV